MNDASNTRGDQSVEKEVLSAENKLHPTVLPGGNSSYPGITQGRSTDVHRPVNQPVFLPPIQNTTPPPPTIQPTSLTEVPLDQSLCAPSTLLNQPKQESSQGPPKSCGPPPSTSYHRPASRLPSSRYPSSSFLQTVPSAQFFPQSTPSTPSVSPSNSLNSFPKSISSSPVTYFIPQQPTGQPFVFTGNTVTSPVAQTYPPPLSQDFKPQTSPSPTLNFTGTANPDLPYLKPAPPAPQTVPANHPAQSLSYPAAFLPGEQPSVFKPLNFPSTFSQPILNSASPLQNLPSGFSPGVNTSVPPLIPSQPLVIPTSQELLPTTGVENPLLQPLTHLSSSSIAVSLPSNSFTDLTKLPNTVPSISSSVLRSASSSPLPKPPNVSEDRSSSPTHIPKTCSPAVLEPSVAESATSLIGNIVAHVNTHHSSNFAPTLKQKVLSPPPPEQAVLTASVQESSVPPNQTVISAPLPSGPGLDTSLKTFQSIDSITTATSHYTPPQSKEIFPQSSINQSITSVPPSLFQDHFVAPISKSVTSGTSDTIPSLPATYLQSNSSQLVDHFSSSPVTQRVQAFHPISSTDTVTDSIHFLPISSPKTIDTNTTTKSSEVQLNSENTSLSSTKCAPETSNVAPVASLYFASSDKYCNINQPSPEVSQLPKTTSETLENFSLSPSSSAKKSTLSASTTAQNLKGPVISKGQEDPSNKFVASQSHLTQEASTPVTSVKTEPSFFTFTSPSASESFPNTLTSSSKPPCVTSTLPPSRNLSSSSTDKNSLSLAASASLQSCGSLFSSAPSAPSTILSHQQNIQISESISAPSELNTSTFFTSSPSTTNQIVNSQPSQISSPSFIPLPPKRIDTPTSTAHVPTVVQTPPTTELINQDTQQISTHTSSPTSITSSYTPPPPYSSLSFSTNSSAPETQTVSSPSLAHTQPIDGVTVSSQGVGVVSDEELDQIPLDGNTIPLYNPLSVGAHYHQLPAPTTKGGINNSYRLGSGLKRPSYAPVPDLGVIHQIPQVLPTMSAPPPLNVTSTTTGTVTTPSTTPSSSVTSSPPSESASFNYAVTAQGQIYRPAYHHWFYKKGGETKTIWQPFSMADSLNLEQVFTSPELNENTKVATDGGRYDVEVVRRRKVAVYWEEPPGEVRRCSWFVRAPVESRYIPYDENIAEILEDSYKTGCLRNEWNRRVELADGEVIILHSPNAMAHHQRSSSPDAWGNTPTMQQKPRIVKRGLEDFEISEGEPNQVDHLLLMVHGIGKVCDLRFRSLVQVVDDFRSVSLQLVQSHFRTGTENGNVGRVEFLPVEWHRALHTETIDKRLSDITLPSIPKAREFTNDVLLDILFYTSPVFCERIVQAVGAEINRVYNLYMTRNPGFRGCVSLGGHSLGSLILFDMLCHQRPRHMKLAYSPQSSFHESDEDMPEVGCLKTKARLNRRMSYLTIGSAGTGQPYIAYPQLNFQPKAFFALGSPIGMFLTVRGLEGLGEDFKFPTCPKFFNIFHPNDPVAYRIEALVSPKMIGVPAVVIPHHKGRKRMHLELKDTMAHVTAALKQKLVDSMRSTWNTVYQLAMFHRPDSSIQQEVDKVIENEILSNDDCGTPATNQYMLTEQEALEMKVGCLNGGDRIDYVLQEAPLETFNQYISAVRSHVVYWESEDTMLLILKELYATIGISPDSQVPQPILPFDISSDTNETYSEYTDSIGAPPTQFIRK
ncbi:uncharacterized protein isoform X2 [Rhodnius prolixus]|uniref:uncharacterized protein isoform X2 n=1 Tax=Rhodnius prolixus TaxID=13249 RepID=UPI003D18C80E